MRPVLLLAQLNEIELALDATRARLREVADALNEPDELQTERRALVEVEAELGKVHARQAEQEQTQKRCADRLTQAEKKLYSGNVHNPKELQDAERDVQQLRRQHSQAEDALLEVMLRLDAVTTEVTQRRADVARLSSDWDARQKQLHAEQGQLREKLAIEQRRQTAARRAVPPALLPVYDSLRARKGGRAIAALDGEMCSACRVDVPNTKIEPARASDELVYCGNCGRVLWGE